MRMRALLLALAAVTLAPAAAEARPDVSTAQPSLRQLARSIVDTGVPGAVVLVRDARGIRAGVAGFANLRTRERMRADHAFRVGSITKTFVATVVLQLAAEGVLRLEDPIERWLPGMVPNSDAITLRHLLNHTSGLPDYTNNPEFSRTFLRNRLKVWTPAELVALTTPQPPLFPGTSWSYSNTGYILLGLVVERATGTTLAEQLRRRIFEPLALTRTSLPDTAALPPPFARGYWLRGNGAIATPGGRPADIGLYHPSMWWAAGALVSTAGDLARFYGALLRGELLAPAQLALMQTTVSADYGGTAGDRVAFGLGLMALTLRCGTVWGHSGGVPGYTSLAFSARDGSRQAVVLVNTNLPPRPAARFEGAFRSAFCR